MHLLHLGKMLNFEVLPHFKHSLPAEGRTESISPFPKEGRGKDPDLFVIKNVRTHSKLRKENTQ